MNMSDRKVVANNPRGHRHGARRDADSHSELEKTREPDDLRPAEFQDWAGGTRFNVSIL